MLDIFDDVIRLYEDFNNVSRDICFFPNKKKAEWVDRIKYIEDSIYKYYDPVFVRNNNINEEQENVLREIEDMLNHCIYLFAKQDYSDLRNLLEDCYYKILLMHKQLERKFAIDFFSHENTKKENE